MSKDTLSSKGKGKGKGIIRPSTTVQTQERGCSEPTGRRWCYLLLATFGFLLLHGNFRLCSSSRRV